MNTVLTIIIILICLLLAVAVVFSLVMFKLCIMRTSKPIHFDLAQGPFADYRDEMKAGAEWFMAQDLQTVSITSYDGLKLCAYYLPCENPRATILLMHGYHSSGTNDFSCIFKLYHDLGFNLLVPDQRAMNRSEGKYLTFGIRERFDCRDWLCFINNGLGGNDLPIILDGISMGCTTVLMSLGLKLPDNVACVIADCGFTSPRAIFTHVLKKVYHLPPFPVLNICSALIKHTAGFHIDEYSTTEGLSENRIPVLFIHGADDGFVPAEMSVENYNACSSEKQLFIAEGAQHGMSYLVKRDECQKLLFSFFDKYAPVK